MGYFISSAHATPFTCGERDGDTGGGMLVVGSSISPVDSTLLDRKWCEGFVGNVVWVWGDSISSVRATPLVGGGLLDANLLTTTTSSLTWQMIPSQWTNKHLFSMQQSCYLSSTSSPSALQPLESDHWYTGLQRHPNSSSGPVLYLCTRLEWPPYQSWQLGWRRSIAVQRGMGVLLHTVLHSFFTRWSGITFLYVRAWRSALLATFQTGTPDP